MKKYSFLILGITFFLSSCGVYNSLVNLSKLKFKLGGVDNFKVGNISVSNKSKLSDFGFMDITKLTANVMSGKFPVTFTVNVLAQNPNKKNGNSNFSNISLDTFPWSLYINDKKTISGNIAKPVNVSAVENATIIPLEMKLDLMDFFDGQGLNNLLDIALKLGGSKSAPTNIKIVAEPVLGTVLGNLSYPEPITIINKNFN